MTVARASLLALLIASSGWLELRAQSTHLVALEGSAPLVEPTAGIPSGLANLLRDPTLSAHSVGVLVGIYRTRAFGMEAFHGVTAFRWGPRWSLAFASTGVDQLFDSTLTNQDPELAALRARALIGSLDATMAHKHASLSAGVAAAADEMIGDTRGSTLVRIHARLVPLGTDELTLGLHWSGVAGGSIAPARGGRKQADLVLTRQIGRVHVSTALAYYEGAQWRFSETVEGYAISTRFDLFSVLHFELGASRHRTSYGVESYAWRKGMGCGLRLHNLTFDMTYNSSALDLGTGYGISIGYEP
jgi:hypothetical protein